MGFSKRKLRGFAFFVIGKDSPEKIAELKPVLSVGRVFKFSKGELFQGEPIPKK